MSDKAIVSRRDMPKDPARARVGDEAKELGFTVEHELPQGTLVRIDDHQRAMLDERGFRVARLHDTNILRVGSYTIDVAAPQPQPDLPADLRVPVAMEHTWPHHLVQLAGPPSDDWIREIEDRGVRVVEPISPYGLFVVGSPAAVAALKPALRFVAWTGPFQPAYRIDEKLLGRTGPLRLDISVYPPDGIAQAKETLAALGATIVRETLPLPDEDLDYATIIADFSEISDEGIAALARVPGVRWLESAGVEPGLEGERDTQLIAGNPSGTPGYQAWLTSVGFSGAGAVISIGDRGVDGNKLNNISGHPDLRGRQVDFIDYSGNPNSRDTDGHGTLVASIAVGNAATSELEAAAPNDFLLGQGVAPGARFVSQNIVLAQGGSPDLNVLTRDAVNHGAQVLNNSWYDKDEPGAGYTANARILDKRVRNPTGSAQDPRSLTIVSSAGNVGPTPSRITPPKEAKNLIVVGASFSSTAGATSTQGIWVSSSRGPAIDGRILPTLVAPGTHVTGAASTWAPSITHLTSSNLYASSFGTSMAAPYVAGCCALLIEWWRSWHNGSDPSPAMLKALLINGADDLGVGGEGETGPQTRIPNAHQGWGRVNLRNILETVPDVPHASRGPRLCFDQDVAFTAQSDDVVIGVKPYAQARPLRITLVWTDAPGAVMSNPALVNNLNLEVTNLATNAAFRGNQFENGFSVSGVDRDFDVLNNVECVYIEHPSGTYDVRVIPASLRRNARSPFYGPAWQDFALVIDNAEAVPS